MDSTKSIMHALFTGNIDKLTGSQIFNISITFVCVLLLAILALYLFQLARYAQKLGKLKKADKGTLILGPITLKGFEDEIIDFGTVERALINEFDNIKKCIDNLKINVPLSYAHSRSTDAGFGLVSLHKDIPVPDIQEVDNHTFMRKFDSTLEIKIFKIRIPIGIILNLIVNVVNILPNPFRKQYYNSLIHMIITKSTELIHMEIRLGKDNKNRTVREYSAKDADNGLKKYTHDAAFIILEMNNPLHNANWQSTQYFMDGLIALNEFRQKGSSDDKKNAKLLFTEAMSADNHNKAAFYYYGVLNMVERKEVPIKEAINAFISAQESPDAYLRSFIHIGLAFCYSQSVHRLGYRDENTLDKAEKEIEHAVKAWQEKFKNSKSAKMLDKVESLNEKPKFKMIDSGIIALKKIPTHPLFLYTKAMVLICDENHPNKVKRYIEALNLLHEAINQETGNNMFCNMVGWIFLKLTEWGELTKPETLLCGDAEPKEIPLLAEKYLKESYEMNKENKLVCANLCLLYSSPYFVDRNKDNEYWNWAKYYGKKAIQMDPKYINGHRDIAIAYIRYNHIDEAYGFFSKALELAEEPNKDTEIIADVIHEIELQINAGKYKVLDLERWQNPESSLLEPNQ